MRTITEILRDVIDNIQEKNKNLPKITILDYDYPRSISRQENTEILPRNNVKVRKLKEDEKNFQEIDNKKFEIICKESENLVFNTNFNNFNRIRWIMELFSSYKNFYPEKEAMLKAYQNMNKEINLAKWTNCSGMATCLKKFLEKNYINSYLVRFWAFWYINDNYVLDGHSWIIIPAKINGEKKFIFLDPGIRIFKPIIFDENGSNEVFCDGKNFSITKNNDENSEFDFCLNSEDLNWNKNSMKFNSREEWLNPDETLIPESVRSRGVYKIQKFNLEENIVFFFNIEKEYFGLKLKENVEKITFSEFIEIFSNKENNEKKELFLQIFEKLWENSEKMIKDLFLIIENLEIFKEVLYTPSTKEIVEKRK